MQSKHLFLFVVLLTIFSNVACIKKSDPKAADVLDKSRNESGPASSNPLPDTPDPFVPMENLKKKAAMGIGLAGVSDWSTQMPFLDLMRSARSWEKEGDLALDSNGWVKTLAPGQAAQQIFLTLYDPAEVQLPYTRYLVRYKGKGRIEYIWNAKKDSAASAPGRDIIDIKAEKGGYAAFRILETDSNDYIREITIVPIQEADRYDQGDIFNPVWIEHIKNFRAVRFMDWMVTNSSEQSRWEDRPKVSDKYWGKGVPLEVMIKLANKIHADPWFNMPHLADQDYMRDFAAMVKADLNPQLTAYVEHSNEVWNFVFGQSQHAIKEARARWGDGVSGGYMQWHGMRTAQMCDTWKSVFAEEKSRVHCTLGAQAAWQGLEWSALHCPDWEKEGQAACYAHGIDSIAIAVYLSAGLNGNDEEQRATVRSWFSDADGGLSKGIEQLKDGRHFKAPDTVLGFLDTFQYFKSIASPLGLRLLAYEGGSHVTGNGTPVQEDVDFQRFHIALNRHPGMYDRYSELFKLWKDAGADLFMHFVDVSFPGKSGSWGALEYTGQASTPKWRAIQEFNAKDCWWENCN